MSLERPVGQVPGNVGLWVDSGARSRRNARSSRASRIVCSAISLSDVSVSPRVVERSAL
jgi:hypothetical protein